MENPPPKMFFGLEPVVALLFFGMLSFTFVLIVCEVWFSSDAQLFQVIASLVSGFSGAFFMRVKPQDGTGSKGDRGGQGPAGAPGAVSGPVIVQQNIQDPGKELGGPNGS